MGNKNPKKIKNKVAQQIFIHFRDLSIEEKKSQREKILAALYQECISKSKTSEYISLNLNTIPLKDSGVEILSQVLSKNPKVTHLTLRKTEISHEGIKFISEMLKTNKTLLEIDLSWNQLGNEGVTDLSRSLLENSTIQSVYLNGVGIEENGILSLSHCLKINKNIRSLEIGSNQLSKKSTSCLLSGLANNFSLTNLKIESKDLSEQETKPLNHIVNRNDVISSIIDEIITNVCQNKYQVTSKVLYKSIRGVEMIEGKKKQVKEAKGTPLYDVFKLSKQESLMDTPKELKVDDQTFRFRAGMAEMMGNRATMEDSSIIIDNWLPKEELSKTVLFANNENLLLISDEGEIDFPEKVEISSIKPDSGEYYAVFDGHGGKEAAEHSAKTLHHLLKEKIMKGEIIEDALTQSFIDIDSQVSSWCVYTGTTALVALTIGDNLWIANVGDTRAVLNRNGIAVRLSLDHKPDIEIERIEQCGGFVKDGRVNGMLAVCRAIGDSFLGPTVSPEPFISSLKISNLDQFLIIACDGVWDVISDQDAVDIVSTEIDPQKAAAKLRDKAFLQGSNDNISVIVVFFK
ncbi:phosphatase 2c [Anaeramoeba ignava]|uniref:Phosphatase 2c n=1 Tax=Anaeramoeba ignava TaxID=1746090 RepID=A0A9Q0LKT8_ANAIG|nr:phosphatase 2c [Anaeramoeba ignava]